MAWNFWLILIHLLMRNSQLFFYTYYFQIFWHGISWKLTLRITLQKWSHKMTSRNSHVTFPGNSYNVCNSLAEMPKFKQVIKLTVGKINLVKSYCKIYRPENIFRKSQVIKLIKSLTNLIYQKMSQCKFQIHIMTRNLLIISWR